MQACPMQSSRLAPLLQAALLPSEPFSAPHSLRSTRLPSLSPRLPMLPSLVSTLAAQSGYASSATSSPVNTSTSISYLLNPPRHQVATVHYHLHQLQQEQLYAPAAPTRGPSTRLFHPYAKAVSSMSLTTFDVRHPQDIKAQLKKKRKTRICKSEGCEKYVVDRGLCIRHGGGKRCSVDDCNCRAQNRGLCWKHGGYTRCTVDGCTKRAKSRGICWSHGGGTRCKHGACSKIAVSHGLCWAHGGGKRCLVETCQKPAYERNGNLCAEHCTQRTQQQQQQQLEGGGAVAAAAAAAATAPVID
uniref:WRKY19-like zinc finger domain-containing protein n=1 Tax=Hyaloperonospora arabidopsidis (strain Emoy2) TaxID=559515 RepID=M4BQU9_HYAAE